MKAYKAFNKDLTCRGYKFDEANVNITDEANCIQNGFHCAENPLDCLSYYPNWNDSVYFIVEASGDIDEDDRDSKISCTELTLIKQLNIEEFVRESILYMAEHPTREWSNNVYAGYAEVDEGFAIVRGKDPKAMGKIGVTIGLAREKVFTSDIEVFSIITIDGRRYMPDTWYDVYGCPMCDESEADE